MFIESRNLLAKKGNPYQLDAVVKEIIKPSPGLPAIKLPNPGKKEHDERFMKTWTIMAATFKGIQKKPRPFFGIGRRIAIEGPKALSKIPCARFGKLFTVDRKEIESLRSIRSMIREYIERDKGKRPLSIAVFGPPGSGKSFGIEEIIKANIELLAEAEHNGWMDQKMKNGWTMADTRDDAKKQHNCLRPYVELNEEDQQKDRNSVRKFPEILKMAGYKTVAMLE
jgi:hypothetical protein